jgi:hypothetical protein
MVNPALVAQKDVLRMVPRSIRIFEGFPGQSWGVDEYDGLAVKLERHFEGVERGRWAVGSRGRSVNVERSFAREGIDEGALSRLQCAGY